MNPLCGRERTAAGGSWPTDTPSPPREPSQGSMASTITVESSIPDRTRTCARAYGTRPGDESTFGRGGRWLGDDLGVGFATFDEIRATEPGLRLPAAVLRCEDEWKREAEAFARSAAGESDGTDDPCDAALDPIVAGRILDDLQAPDIALAHHREANGNLARKLWLEAKRRLVAAIDFRKVFGDLLAHDEGIDAARRPRMPRAWHAGD